MKYFLSNAPEGTATETLLLVAFSRCKIERMFQDSKMELGMDHFEVRKFNSISRHLILSCVSYLFLAEFHQQQTAEEKKRRADAQPGGYGHTPPGGDLGRWGTLFDEAGPSDQRATGDNATTQRQGRPQSPQTHHPTITCHWRGLEEGPKVSMAEVVAL